MNLNDANKQPFTETVTISLLRGFNSDALTGDFDAQGDEEDWPLVMEQAYAQYMGTNGISNYSNLDGVNAVQAWQTLTGGSANTVSVSGDSGTTISNLIQTNMATGAYVVLGTKVTRRTQRPSSRTTPTPYWAP